MEKLVKLRDGLFGDEFTYKYDASLKKDVSTGALVFPVDKSDLKLWFDPNIFYSPLAKEKPLSFTTRHVGCPLGWVQVHYETDRPKHKLVCTTCCKRWELHQLENMRPKDFSSIFEYKYSPRDDWPNVIRQTGDGVSAYNTCSFAWNLEAGEYFYKEFQGFKSNGFRWKSND